MNLYLTTGHNGSIWSGRPNIQDAAPQLYREYHTTSGEIFYAIAHNADPTTTTDLDTFEAIACGSHGTLLLSDRSGSAVGSWDVAHTASNPLNSICYGDGNFIAVGPNNFVIYSQDSGATWTETRGAIPGANWTWVVAANEPTGWRYVAVGSTTILDPADPYMQNHIVTGAIMYSDDGGVTWTKGSVGANAVLNAIAYSPDLNVYVAVGNKHLNTAGKLEPTIVSVDGSRP